jgi:hypothetical protein
MFSSKNFFFTPASGAFTVSKSLRFRASASAYLNRTFSAPTSATIWTWSAWVKRGALTGTYRLFGASTTTFLTFNSSDQINLTLNNVSAATSTAVFRDPSAWYHIVYQQNGSAQTIWVNNNSVATGTTAASIFNTAIAHQIGAANTTNYFDGYLAEVNFIDGQALTPTDFGVYDTNGVWQPKGYTGTYGTNGFYLPFTNTTSTTTLVADSSGNGNNWTPNNISLTAGVTYDSMLDSPTNATGDIGNYCVLNPLDTGGTAPSAANLQLTAGAAERGVRSTFAIPTSGLWYGEATVGTNQSGATDIAFGFAASTVSLTANPSGLANVWGIYGTGNTNITRNGASTLAGAGAALTSGEILQFAIDLTNNKGWVGRGNVWFNGTTGTDGDPATGANPTFTFSSPPTLFPHAHCYSSTIDVNFGQRPFSYTPPSGFVALNTQNLPTGTITTSGSFTGNGSPDGPFVYLNGVPTAMTINGNAVTFGTHADKLAGGFKVRSSSASYNVAGSNTYSITSTGGAFKTARAQGNP